MPLDPRTFSRGERRRVRRSQRGLAAALAALLVLAACTTAEDDSAQPVPTQPEQEAPAEVGPIAVVATTSILRDVVATLVGDDGEVIGIMPPGADPHDFQPSAADGARIRDADLVIANGLVLEESLVSMLAAAEVEGVNVFYLADQLDPIAYDNLGGIGHGHEEEGHGHEEEHGHGHEEEGHGHEQEHGHGHEEEGHGHEEDDHDHPHGPEDPHVWFDPIRMADGVRLIAAALAELDSGITADEWQERAEVYAAEILEVHDELTLMFASIPTGRRVLVTNHDALGYLAHRYGFELLGTIVPGASTQAETDPRRFVELIQAVEAAGVQAIFADNTDSTRLAEQLASEVVGRSDLEVQVVRLYTDALGPAGSGAETYLGLLRTTAALIVEALA